MEIKKRNGYNEIVKMSDKDIQDKIVNIEKTKWFDTFLLVFGFACMIIFSYTINILSIQEYVLVLLLCLVLIILGSCGLCSSSNKQEILINRLDMRKIIK